MATEGPPIEWPPLPAHVHSLLGPIAVRVTAGPFDPTNPDTLGLWEPAARVITIRGDVAPEVQWSTLWHERLHAIIWHAGVYGLSRGHEEALCDALGVAMAAELFDALRGAR